MHAPQPVQRWASMTATQRGGFLRGGSDTADRPVGESGQGKAPLECGRLRSYPSQGCEEGDPRGQGQTGQRQQPPRGRARAGWFRWQMRIARVAASRRGGLGMRLRAGWIKGPFSAGHGRQNSMRRGTRSGGRGPSLRPGVTTAPRGAGRHSGSVMRNSCSKAVSKSYTSSKSSRRSSAVFRIQPIRRKLNTISPKSPVVYTPQLLSTVLAM